MPKCRVFIVEDSAVVANSLTQALQEVTGVAVVGNAASEATAVHWLTENRDAYELVIVDVFLSAGSGLNVLRACRALMSGSTLVVLTNYATREVHRVCSDFGATQVFDKSTQLEELFGFCRQFEGAMLPPTLN